jgi:hypothetical protein
MRGVVGIGLIGLGLLMAYLVLSGKFPGPIPTLNTGATSTPTTSNSVVVGGSQHAPGRGPVASGGPYYSSSSVGIPTMANLDDLIASHGGMQQ